MYKFWREFKKDERPESRVGEKKSENRRIQRFGISYVHRIFPYVIILYLIRKAAL